MARQLGTHHPGLQSRATVRRRDESKPPTLVVETVTRARKRPLPAIRVYDGKTVAACPPVGL